jgi:hypothetical protein
LVNLIVSSRPLSSFHPLLSSPLLSRTSGLLFFSSVPYRTLPYLTVLCPAMLARTSRLLFFCSVPYCSVPYCALPCLREPRVCFFSVPYRSVPYRTVPYSNLREHSRTAPYRYWYHTEPYRSAPQYRTVLEPSRTFANSTAPYRYHTEPYRSAPQYRTVLYRIVQYRSVPYCKSLLYRSVPYCKSLLYRTVLYCALPCLWYDS